MKVYQALICQTIANEVSRKNPDCPDLDKAEECEIFCADDMFACLTNCSNEACYSVCYRENINCIDGKRRY